MSLGHTEYAVHRCFVRLAQLESSAGVILVMFDLFGSEMTLAAAYIWQQPKWGSDEYCHLFHDGLDRWKYLSRRGAVALVSCW